METLSRKFRIIDTFYVTMMCIPVFLGIILQILTKPTSESINITGARIFFTIPMPFQDLPVTESQVNSLIVMIVLFFFCLYMTHGLKEKVCLKRQHFAEIIVEKTDSMVKENMGDYFAAYPPFIISIMALSALSSLISLFGLFAPTSDINIVAGWAVLVFILITYYKMKCGILYYLKSFTQPIPVLTPINMMNELATPISMTFRHYGNILSGSVISLLVASALSGLSSLVFSFLPEFLSKISFLQIGIPAVLSVYFDVFSSCLQAFIFAMLTMMNVAGGFPADEFERRKLKKFAKNN